MKIEYKTLTKKQLETIIAKTSHNSEDANYEYFKYFEYLYFGFSKPTRFLTAFDNNKLVGNIELQINPDDNSELWMLHVEVHPDYQNLGIAKVLLENAFIIAKKEKKRLKISSYSREGKLKIKSTIDKLKLKYNIVMIREERAAMKTFKELYESLEKKYVAIQFDAETQDKLRKWALDQGFDLTTDYDGSYQGIHDFDFHCTIFFSTSIHDIDNGDIKIENILTGKQQIKVFAKRFIVLGIDRDIPALELAGEDLFKIRDFFENGFSMKDAWNKFIPHVSVSYAKDKTIIPTPNMISLPDFPLTANIVKIDKAEL